MAIPTRPQAAAILLDLEPSPRLLAHVCAVADVAAFLAARLQARGVAIDRRLAETAALLHDVDKLFPAGDARRAAGHGLAGARWLADQGWAELGGPVAAHPVGHLLDHEDTDAWLSATPVETLLVAYADKRAAQHVEPLRARFARWRRGHPDRAAWLSASWPRAERLEAYLCDAAGVAPASVGRLRWARRTIGRVSR